MNAEQQQKHFNEIAEMMADNKITTEQACSLFKELCDDAGNALEHVLKQNEELKRKMKYLELNNWTVFCEVQKYGNDQSDSEGSCKKHSE